MVRSKLKQNVGFAAVLEEAAWAFQPVCACVCVCVCVLVCVCVCDTLMVREKRHAEARADPSSSFTWPPQAWFFSIPTDETLLYVLFTSCLDYHNCLLAGPTCLSSSMGSKCR
jgi:hypothetical protein